MKSATAEEAGLCTSMYMVSDLKAIMTHRYSFVKCSVLGRRWRMLRDLGNNTDLNKILFTAGRHNSIYKCSEIKMYKTHSTKVAPLLQ